MKWLTNLRSHSVTIRIRKTQEKKENWKTEKSSSQPPMSKIHMEAKLVLHSHQREFELSHKLEWSSITTRLLVLLEQRCFLHRLNSNQSITSRCCCLLTSFCCESNFQVFPQFSIFNLTQEPISSLTKKWQNTQEPICNLTPELSNLN